VVNSDLIEQLDEEGEYEEDIVVHEDSVHQDLADAIGSWAVLSKYQSTHFQYQILTKGRCRF